VATFETEFILAGMAVVGFGVFRSGDVAARFLFGLAGLIVGVVIIALPTAVPIAEDILDDRAGFIDPDPVRFMQRHARFMNRSNEAAACRQNARFVSRRNARIR